MAIVQDTVSLGEKSLYTVDSDPSIGVGLTANISDLAIDPNGNMYIKQGALDTDWKKQIIEEDALAYSLIFG